MCSSDLKFLQLFLLLGELLEYSKTNYKRSNARRGVLEVPASYAQSPKKQEELQELFNKNFKDFFEAETGAVLPLSSGLTYTDLTNDTYKNGSDSRDIRELIDDIFDFVALAFRISPQLLKGSVADSDKSVDNMLMLCINPLKVLGLAKHLPVDFVFQKALNRIYTKHEHVIHRLVTVGHRPL